MLYQHLKELMKYILKINFYYLRFSYIYIIYIDYTCPPLPLFNSLWCPPVSISASCPLFILINKPESSYCSSYVKVCLAIHWRVGNLSKLHHQRRMVVFPSAVINSLPFLP